MLRITGGIFRGRVIKAIESKDLRPTTSFFREWLFNVLNNITDIENTKLLDLFAGSGIVGFEFLSRGADKVIYVESAAKVITQLKDNTRNLKIEAKSVIRQQDAVAYLDQQTEWRDCNFIFLDPPYQADLPNKILAAITENTTQKDDLIIIIEARSGYPFIIPSGWVIFKQKSTGTTSMTIITPIS